MCHRDGRTEVQGLGPGRFEYRPAQRHLGVVTIFYQ
jgi:hypothetical protein